VPGCQEGLLGLDWDLSSAFWALAPCLQGPQGSGPVPPTALGHGAKVCCHGKGTNRAPAGNWTL